VNSNKNLEGKLEELQVLNEQKMKTIEKQNLEIQKLTCERDETETKYSKISSLESDLKAKFIKIKND